MRAFISLLAAALFTFNAARAETQATNIAVNGCQIHCEIHGTGEPLLLLHGFNASGTVWDKFVPAFAEHYRVVVADMRGHGQSTNPSDEFTHRQSARDMLAMLDALGIGKVKAAGISSGGMTLLHMATQAPDRIESMILIGATTHFPEQARAIMRRSTVESLKASDYERLRKIHVHGDEQIRALRRQFHAFKDNYEDMNFMRPSLSKIKARTLIIHGDRDEFFPVDIPVEMYRSIANSALWIVPNGPHVPIHSSAVPFTATALAHFRGGRDR